MYVPHYDAILHAIGVSRQRLTGRADITIPLSLFKLLLRIAVSHGEFDESGYLAANRDVQEAVRAGQILDPKEHYVSFGYFEGRRGAWPMVDEAWYRRTNPDVAAAIARKEIASGSAHFAMIGAEEFRAPSAAYVDDTLEWKRATKCG
jgi:hypothetical protein